MSISPTHWAPHPVQLLSWQVTKRKPTYIVLNIAWNAMWCQICQKGDCCGRQCENEDKSNYSFAVILCNQTENMCSLSLATQCIICLKGIFTETLDINGIEEHFPMLSTHLISLTKGTGPWEELVPGFGKCSKGAFRCTPYHLYRLDKISMVLYKAYHLHK